MRRSHNFLSQFDFYKFADALSVVSFLSSFFALSEAGERWRVPLVVATTVAGLWLSYSIGLRIRRIRDLGKKRPAEPRVLLLGGEQYRSVMDEIANHPFLRREPFIEFVNIVVPETDDVKRRIGTADAVILMPDFSRSTDPALLEWVLEHCERAPIPIVRYYPEGYQGTELTEVAVLPFHTPSGIVEYASEFLLKKAVDRGRYVGSRWQLSRALNWIALPMIVGLLVLALWRQRQVDFELAQKERPASNRSEMLQALASERSARVTGASEDAVSAAEVRTITTLAKVLVEDITRLSRSLETKRIYVFALSSDGQKLLPLARYGVEGYGVDAVNSIAACSYLHSVVTYWEGQQNKTKVIQAFSIDGRPTGVYDPNTQSLRLNGTQCRYDVVREYSDPQSHLFCLPIGADGSRQTMKPSGVLCLAADGSDRYFSEPWLRSLMIRESMLLGRYDLSSLLQYQQAEAQRQMSRAVQAKPAATRGPT